MSTDGHINFTNNVVDEEIGDFHTDISTDGYDDAHYQKNSFSANFVLKYFCGNYLRILL